MKFRNDKDEGIMIQRIEQQGVSSWISIQPGKVVDLEEGVGKSRGLTPLDEKKPETKAVESKVATKTVETKMVEKPEVTKSRKATKKKKKRWL